MVAAAAATAERSHRAVMALAGLGALSLTAAPAALGAWADPWYLVLVVPALPAWAAVASLARGWGAVILPLAMAVAWAGTFLLLPASGVGVVYVPGTLLLTAAVVVSGRHDGAVRERRYFSLSVLVFALALAMVLAAVPLALSR